MARQLRPPKLSKSVRPASPNFLREGSLRRGNFWLLSQVEVLIVERIVKSAHEVGGIAATFMPFYEHCS